MNVLGWVLVFFFFLIIFIIGSSKFWKSISNPPRYWRGENTNEKSADWLVTQIQKAKKSALIVSGNLNPYVYDKVADILIKRLREALNLKIKILTSCEILALQRNGNLENKLLNLFADLNIESEFGERFQIAFLEKRPTTHFRSIDSSYLYVEEPHGVGASRRTVEVLERSIFKSWQYERYFERLWQTSEVAKPTLVLFERAAKGGAN